MSSTSSPAEDIVYDVAVIGAGVAGCAIAVALADQGRRVVLIERSLREPDRIVGELLQPGGVAALEALGLEDCLENIDAVPLYGYRLLYYGEEITFRYPERAKYEVWEGLRKANQTSSTREKSGSPLHEGRSFHHGRFVTKLREAARRESGLKLVEATVTDLKWSDTRSRVVGVECRSQQQETRVYHAHLTIAADGQASKFRASLTSRTPESKSRFWGLQLKDADLGAYGLSFGVVNGLMPIGIYENGSRETRVLIDIPNTLSQSRTEDGGIRSLIESKVVPSLPAGIQKATLKALDDGSLRSMPNSWLPACSSNVSGVCLLGDAMNTRHAIGGSGMTAALDDAVLLSQLLQPRTIPSLEDSNAVQRQLRGFHQARKNYSMPLNIFAQVLYCVVTGQEPHWVVLQRGLVGYAQKDEKTIEELSALIGGVLHSPSRLLYHFAAIMAFTYWLYVHDTYLVSKWRVPLAVLEFPVIFVKAATVLGPYCLPEIWA